jgi:hypothetical protein
MRAFSLARRLASLDAIRNVPFTSKPVKLIGF